MDRGYHDYAKLIRVQAKKLGLEERYFFLRNIEIESADQQDSLQAVIRIISEYR